MNERGCSCRQRPRKKPSGNDPVHVEPINYPAGYDLEQGVSPEKRGKQNAELRSRKPKLVFQQRCRNGEVTAVNVIDEDSNGEQRTNTRQQGRRPLLI